MPFAARCYVVGMVLLAAGTIATVPWSSVPPIELATLGLLVVVVERSSMVRVNTRVTASVSLVIGLAAILILPPAGAAAVGMAAGMGRKRASQILKTLFNIAMGALVLAAGSAVCHALGGHTGSSGIQFPAVFLPFLAGAAVCWLLNGLLLAVAMQLFGIGAFWAVWRGDLMRATTHYGSAAALSLIITVLWSEKPFGYLNVLLVMVPMYVGHWTLSQYAEEQSAYDSTISALVKAVEIKDHYTRGHSERVALGAELIARQLDLPADRVGKIRYAGLLHDIGKVGVPTRILAKVGRLTDDEYEAIRQHPNTGVAVVRDITFLTEVYEGILFHHERLDGKGYPTGKKGDQIPEFARILGVADAFDAMTSSRSYRPARPVTEALMELWRGAGTQFDPSIVRAFDEALALQERAGHPWRVTETSPIGNNSPHLAEQRHAYSFADHDDPAADPHWYGGQLEVVEGVAGGVTEGVTEGFMVRDQSSDGAADEADVA